jgi:hypothetical protein
VIALTSVLSTRGTAAQRPLDPRSFGMVDKLKDFARLSFYRLLCFIELGIHKFFVLHEYRIE